MMTRISNLASKALMLSSVLYAMPYGYVLGYLPKDMFALLLDYFCIMAVVSCVIYTN